MNLINNKSNINYSKELNATCFCKIGLPWKKDKIVMSDTCEHMYHQSCANKIKNNICPICNTKFNRLINLLDNNIHPQQFADILSMSYYADFVCNINPISIIDSLFDILTVLARLPIVNTRQDGRELAEKILTLNNVTLHVFGQDKLNLVKNKVIISNHVAPLELIILHYLFEPAFLSSNIFNDNVLLSRIKNIVNILTFSRGDKKGGLVNKMKDYVDKHGTLCLFPEGIMKHPDTLTRFRTGAFHIGRPIYPIVIKHNDIAGSPYFEKFLFSLGSKRDIQMEVHVLGPYYPPFSNTDIEKIRLDMGKAGDMVLSRVSNRDIVD